MKITRIALVSALVLICVVTVGDKKASSDTKSGLRLPVESAVPPQGPPLGGAPAGIAPNKVFYTVQEGDAFVVVLNGECRPDQPKDAIFELRPPTPSFVHLTPFCLCNGSAIALVTVAPQLGDAGKHKVEARVKACGQSTGGVFQFTVKVKQGAAPGEGSDPLGSAAAGIFPNKTLYTIQEDDAVIVVFNAECRPDQPKDAIFELLPPTPSFVHPSSSCLCEDRGRAIAGLNVFPRPGDAGKHKVRARVKACGQSTSAIIEFTVKVKRAG